MELQPFNAPVLVDPSGKPARRATDQVCPKCGSGPQKRIASCGFGLPHPLCAVCGYEWMDEVWRG